MREKKRKDFGNMQKNIIHKFFNFCEKCVLQ